MKAIAIHPKDKFAGAIDTTFPVQEAGRAHQYVKENRNIGKVILTVGNSAP